MRSTVVALVSKAVTDRQAHAAACGIAIDADVRARSSPVVEVYLDRAKLLQKEDEAAP
jgi:hypothetical protein